MKDLKQGIVSVVKGKNFSPAVITTMIVVIFLLANTLVSVAYALLVKRDTTVVGEDLSITDAAKHNFTQAQNAGKKITVTFCMDEASIQNHDTGNYVYRTALEFAKKYPDFITIRYADVFTLRYTDSGETFNVAKYQRAERKDSDGKPILDEAGNVVYDEYALSRGSVIFECDSYDNEGNLLRNNMTVLTGSSAYVDFFTLDGNGYISSYNGEEVMTAMINWVISNEHKTAYYTVGHGEVPSANFYTALVCAGFYVSEINLRKNSVPDDAALVVISNPKSDFERSAEGSGVISELDRLDDYKKRGGAFYVVLDPLAKRLSNLEDFIADFGITIPSENNERFMVKDLNQAIGTDGFTLIASYANTPVANEVGEKISEYGGNVIVKDVAMLHCDESKGAKPLLTSSSYSVLEASGATVNSDGTYTVVAYSERYNESGKDAKLVLVPSVYLTADDAMVTNGYSNKDFIYSLFDVFYGAENMPYGTKSIVQQSTMLENLTLGNSILYTGILLAIPVLLAAFGTVTIIRRKNR